MTARWKRLGLLLCLCTLLSLEGCAMLNVEGEIVSVKPALQLLSMPPYEDVEAQAEEAKEAAAPLRIDLWLDASQLMGGINESPDSLYPHTSRKYRQGGFHYRFDGQVGWYEQVLRTLLSVAGESQTRLLRVGNERLPDSFLQGMGLSFADAEEARSLRRDMLTYAVDPMPDIFEGFSSESMEDSFYSLGSPQANQTARFSGKNAELLENPTKLSLMNDALNAQIEAFDTEGADLSALSAVGDDLDSPLLYALSNLDLSRLSVITCDPATLRKLSGNAADGSPQAYLQQVLEERGIFDRGLSVGLYALQLDFLGEMTSFGAADFSDPLIWGRLNYNSRSKSPDAALPMPRILLMLVIGGDSQVRSYTDTLTMLLSNNITGLRGPQEGQLSYTRNGQTITQQPFSFWLKYTEIKRPSAGYYTQHTQGAALSVSNGTVTPEGELFTASLATEEASPSTLTFSWPAASLPDGLSLDISRLSNLKAEVIDSLLLSEVAANSPNTIVTQTSGTQSIALRDKLYLFKRQTTPFAKHPEQNPFTLSSVALSNDGAVLEATIEVNQALLKPGYYRLRLSADSVGEQFEWPEVSWAQDGGSSLSTVITNEQINEWESFSAVLTRYARASSTIPRQFDHAWGGYTDKAYKGTVIPDFPPVYLAPHLSELLSQLRTAARPGTSPYLRCVFDVFVDAQEQAN
ncbi:MAG: hypothetical protein PHI98_00460 [Eubacteriales bacterium]|nr:hypothetical protein [Eubacteriales bacterium]